MVKNVSEEEFLETLTLPGYKNTKSDYERLVDQQMYYSLYKRIQNALKKGKTTSHKFNDNVSAYKSLCEKLGIRNQLNV